MNRYLRHKIVGGYEIVCDPPTGKMRTVASATERRGEVTIVIHERPMEPKAAQELALAIQRVASVVPAEPFAGTGSLR